MVTFSELCPLTVYSCSIFAFTVAPGSTSLAIDIRTAKSGIANIYKMYKKFEFEKGSRDRNKK